MRYVRIRDCREYPWELRYNATFEEISDWKNWCKEYNIDALFGFFSGTATTRVPLVIRFKNEKDMSIFMLAHDMMVYRKNK